MVTHNLAPRDFSSGGWMQRDGDALIGSWRLDSFELQSTSGEISHPYGRELTGYLFYNDDGYMSAAFMNADRGCTGTGDGELSRAAEASDYDQFMAYTGRFEVIGDKITHAVEVSSLEAFIGSIQERWYKVDGTRLELLTAPLVVGGDAPVGRLVWSRVMNATSA
jgi:hypothetical protein